MSDDSRRFEGAMKRLEEIVEELEKGEFSLQESLERFEEGLKLGKMCRSMLDEAETKIKKLVEDEEGRVHETEVSDEL